MSKVPHWQHLWMESCRERTVRAQLRKELCSQNPPGYEANQNPGLTIRGGSNCQKKMSHSPRGVRAEMSVCLPETSQMPPTRKAGTEWALGSAGAWTLSGFQETNAWEVSGTLEMGPRVLSALSITLPPSSLPPPSSPP